MRGPDIALRITVRRFPIALSAPASSSGRHRGCDPTFPKFSEFAQEAKPLDGEKMSIDAVLNKEILILGFKTGQSKFKEGGYTTVQFELDGVRHVFFTGSQVIADQLQKYAANIPFLATVQKINRYYTLT
jgi:hypothetical protein